MIADLHVHTYFSCDSIALMERYCERAIEKGVSYLCFTDHVDYNKNDEGFGYYEPDKYFVELEKVRNRYQDEITILSGMEFSEPHLYREELKALSDYPYDFIIGSIHFVNDLFPSREVREKYSKEQFFKMYWKEVLEAVTYGHFDCLGHMDFPKRCYGEAVYDYEIIQNIFETMINKQISLEINTSSLRYGVKTTLPNLEILKLYKKCGGQNVTIGSDAHRAEDLAADHFIAKDMINKASLNEVVFQNHLPIQI